LDLTLLKLKINFCGLLRKSEHYHELQRISNKQDVSCEGACGHAHVRCAVARVRVRAKRLLKYVCDVRACGHF